MWKHAGMEEAWGSEAQEAHCSQCRRGGIGWWVAEGRRKSIDADAQSFGGLEARCRACERGSMRY